MKRENITPKIIELAKKIAEHWRMEYYPRCWTFFELPTDNKYLGWCMDKYREHAGVIQIYLEKTESFTWQKPDTVIFVPSISDCLEKLREFAEENIQIFIDMSLIWVVTINAFSKKSRVFTESRNLHEALLQALLTVLKEA